MARPIEGIPPFKGKAAEWLIRYLKTARPDPAKQERARQDHEVAKRVKPLTKAKPVLIQTKSGWLARGDGWAVEGATEEEAMRKFEEAERRHQEIEARPLFYEWLNELEAAQGT